ncbi:MAG: SDH family Clp fold serine proteinase [Methermicoccaceae archaeon]
MYDPTALLWLAVLFYLIISPQLKFHQLQAARSSIMRAMAEKRESAVITLIHRQESLGLFGIPFYRFIDIEDSEQVLRAIRMVPKGKPIELIVHTPGGLVLAATQIAKALKEHEGEVRVIVPHYAMSGGTLIALAADVIIMSPNAVLGPVDPQIKSYPAPSILNAVGRKDTNELDDETLILADVAEKSIQQVREFVYSLLVDKHGEKEARELAVMLTEGRWTHDYPITVEAARSLGLNVSTDVPEEVYKLMEHYPQPLKQRISSVEFIPAPSEHNGKSK